MNVNLLADDLNQLLTGEARSLARHLDEAKPYLDAVSYPLWNKLKHLDETSRVREQRLIQLFQKLDRTPPAVTFQTAVADFHYLDLKTLCPLLIDQKRHQTALYHRAIQHAQPDAAVVAELQDLLSQTQSELELLDSCATARHA